MFFFPKSDPLIPLPYNSPTRAVTGSICFALLGLILSIAPPANAQLIIQGNVRYYTGAATINTEIYGNDVIVGKQPSGIPANAAGDTNLGTTAGTRYTVTIADNAFVSQNAVNDGYQGLSVYNLNRLSINRSSLAGSGTVHLVQSFDNSVTTVTGMAGVLRTNGFGNSTTNLSGDISRELDLADAYENSTTNISGNRVAQVRGYSTSKVNISGGAVPTAYSFNNATTTVSGTGFVGYLNGLQTSINNITGGSVFNAIGRDSSRFNISGGNVFEVFSYNSSTFNITGGTIGKNTIHMFDTGVLNLFGIGLGLSPVGNGSNANGNYTEYLLSGTLLDGQSINGVSFFDYDGGNAVTDPGNPNGASSSLNFNPLIAAAAPEPGTLALLGAGLGIAGLGVRRRLGR